MASVHSIGVEAPWPQSIGFDRPATCMQPVRPFLIGCQSSFLEPEPARSNPSKPNGWFLPSKSCASELPKAVKTAAPVMKKPMAGANSARGQEPVAS